MTSDEKKNIEQANKQKIAIRLPQGFLFLKKGSTAIKIETRNKHGKGQGPTVEEAYGFSARKLVIMEALRKRMVAESAKVWQIKG